jgi:hypothetical protein
MRDENRMGSGPRLSTGFRKLGNILIDDYGGLLAGVLMNGYEGSRERKTVTLKLNYKCFLELLFWRIYFLLDYSQI